MVKSTLAAFAERLSFSEHRRQNPNRLTPRRLRIEVLSGLTVALALVPEAVAFSFVAGVHPLVGLYAAFIVGLVTAVFGGRPGMISGATGALAVVMVSLVAQHGLNTCLPPWSSWDCCSFSPGCFGLASSSGWCRTR